MVKQKKPKLIYQIIELRDEILKIAEKHGVENIRVFGSVSRKQEKAMSDIDLLVDVTTKSDGSEGDYISFAIEVGGLFENKTSVEVCTPETLHPRFKDKVLANCISIMDDEPQIDYSQVDERDLVVNIEKAQKSIKEFWEVIEGAGKEKFIIDKATQHIARGTMQIAVEELVRQIPNAIKIQIDDVNWADLKRFRNFLVHHYDNVIWRTMWDVSQQKIKETEHACDRVLEVLGEIEGEGN